jgi:hypothetical protein
MPPKVHRGCFYIGPVEPEQQALPAPNHTVVDDNFSNGRKHKQRKSTLWDENMAEFRVITNTVNPSSSTFHIPEDLQPQQNQLEQATVMSFKDSLSQPITNDQEISYSLRNDDVNIPSLMSPINLRASSSTGTRTLEEAVEGLLDLRTRPHTWITTPNSGSSTSFNPTMEDFNTGMPSVAGLDSSESFLMEGMDTTDIFTEPSTDLGDSICMEDFNTPDFDMPGNLPQVEGDINLESVIPRVYKPPTPRVKSVKSVLDILRDARMGLLELISLVLEAPESSFAYHRSSFYSERSSSWLSHLFDLIWMDEKGQKALKTWMLPHALELICDTIHLEMEDAKPLLQMSTNDVTPEFIENFDIEDIMKPAAEKTPVWTQILTAATESKESLNKIKTSRSRNRVVVCGFYYVRACSCLMYEDAQGRHVISAQVHNLRSFNSCKLQMGFGLMAWVTTCGSQQLLNTLNGACLTMSFPSIKKIVDTLADHAIAAARKISLGPHALQYDNVNTSTSIYVEQTANTKSKVQSGTFSILYELPNASPEHMDIAPMMTRLQNSSPLRISDLRPTIEAAKAYKFQTRINIIRILTKHVKGFSTYENHPQLQHQPRRPLPNGVKTKFYPLRCATIGEATITGNLLVHDDVYIAQLKRRPEDLCTMAIPAPNDQLTNARMRGAQELRKQDLTPWFRREVFQIGFGPFHFIMNLIWALLNVYRGSLNDIGSLTHLFAVLDKVRLGGEKPDYHTLLAALTQILEGLILNAWRNECASSGFETLERFASSEPTAEQLHEYAETIIQKYATPDETVNPVKWRSKKKSSTNSTVSITRILLDIDTIEDFGDEQHASDNEESSVDAVHGNTVKLTCDLLRVIELVDATAVGDFGRFEDLLPDCACIFRAAGSNNYATEVLHWIFNVKEVWTPEFANIMRDMMLVNPSGRSGHFMGIDMNIEHNIGYLKVSYK